jgi:TetR/AcrR family transcriptional repressor of bet genes
MGRPSNTNERQSQIARALLPVMAKKGYDGATVADVAKVADIAPGLLHYHFKNKLEILLAAIVELEADYETRLDEALSGASSKPAAELDAFIDAHLHVGAGADPVALACWINVTGEALREPRVRRAVERVLASALFRLRSILERGTKEGAFACREPDVAAAAILATIQGYFVLAATARPLIPEGSASRATRAMALALAGRPAPLAKRRPTRRAR